MSKIEEKSFNNIKKHYEKVNIRDLNNGEPFFYLGSISLNLPENVIIEPNNERSIIFHLKHISEEEDNYILKLVKVSDEEAVSLDTGVHFRIGQKNENIKYNNPNKLLKSWYINPCLTISKSGIGKYSDLYSKYVYHKYGKSQTTDIIDLKSLANKKCENSFNEIFKKLYPSEFEQDFYDEYENLVCFYREVPEVGEYFGYVGNISQIVPRRVINGTVAYFERQEVENKYPLFFKKISDNEAIEVTSGIKFYLKTFAVNNIQDEKMYEETPLSIDAVAYIMPTEEYIEIYGKATSNIEEFNKWLHEQEDEGKTLYAQKLRECELAQYPSVEESYDVARVENAMFDLEKQSSAEEPRVHKLIKEISTVTSDFD